MSESVQPATLEDVRSVWPGHKGRYYRPCDLLPHGDAFLFVDEILDFTPRHLVARRRTPVNSFWHEAHFPGDPMVPGVILLEGLVQTCGLHIRLSELEPGEGPLKPRPGYLAEVTKARFLQPVRPGSVIVYRAERRAQLDHLYAYDVTADVSGETVAQAATKLFVGVPNTRRLGSG